MRRTTLTDQQRTELQQARYDRSLSPRERDRVEMVLLSASGWSPPRIASHFGCSAKPVRAVLDRYPTAGLDAMRRKRPGPPPDTVRRTQVTTALQTSLAEECQFMAEGVPRLYGQGVPRLYGQGVARLAR